LRPPAEGGHGGLEGRERADEWAGGVDCDVAAANQLDGADRSPAIGDAVLPEVRSAARREGTRFPNAFPFPGLGIITMSRPNAVSVRHRSRAAPRASRLKRGIVIFTNADSSGGQLTDPNTTGGDNAPTCGFTESVESAPVLEGEDALRC
jgi:hypothetical protein